jgi:hypothetical protein
MVLCHEAPNSGYRRVLAQTSDLSIAFDSVVFESLKSYCFVGTLGLLWLCVYLLLPLFSSSAKPQDQVQSGFFLNVVVTQSAAILKLLSCKDQTLLIRRNSFLVLDFCLDIINSVTGLHIQRDGLA